MPNEKLKYQKEYKESLKKLEEQWSKEQQKHDGGKPRIEVKDGGLVKTSREEIPTVSSVEEVAGVKKLLQDKKLLRKSAEEEVNNLRNQLLQWKRSEAAGNSKISKLHKLLEDEVHQTRKLEEEIVVLQSQLLQLSFEADETRRRLDVRARKVPNDLDSLISQVRHPQLRDSGDGEKASIAKLFEQGGGDETPYTPLPEDQIFSE